MKYLAIFILSTLTVVCFSQNSKQTTTKVPLNTAVTNSAGSFFINYEIKSSNQSVKTGKVFYATDNNLFLISPSNSGLKDVSSLRMLIDLKVSEMTMLTIDSKNKKSGLLTKLPKPVLNKTTANNKPPVLIKTGLYKTISGFKCEKTLVNIGDSINIEAYSTSDIIIDIANAITLTNSSLKNKSPFALFTFDVKGTVLECVLTKKNGVVIKLNVSDINKGKPDAAAFNTDGYTIMDARSLPMFNAQ